MAKECELGHGSARFFEICDRAEFRFSARDLTVNEIRLWC